VSIAFVAAPQAAHGRMAVTDMPRPIINPNAFYESRIRTDNQVVPREVKLARGHGKNWKIVRVPTRSSREVLQERGPDSQPAERRRQHPSIAYQRKKVRRREPFGQRFQDTLAASPGDQPMMDKSDSHARAMQTV